MVQENGLIEFPSFYGKQNYITWFFFCPCLGGAMVGGFAGGMGASNMGPVGSGMSRLIGFNQT